MKVELLDNADVPTPPRAMSKRAKEAHAIVAQLVSGKTAKVTPDKDQSLRGVKASLSRVATSQGKKVVTYDDGTHVYARLAEK